jgi:hypothetical protein
MEVHTYKDLVKHPTNIYQYYISVQSSTRVLWLSLNVYRWCFKETNSGVAVK